MRRRGSSGAPEISGVQGARESNVGGAAPSSGSVVGEPRVTAMAGADGLSSGRGKPTMTDVARIAGVSQTSVSLILNRMVGARISEATRQRVVEAAREIGYELPSSRRPYVTALDRNVIAYVVDEISTSPHPIVSFDGARDAGWKAGS